ncbi:hypothetical protein PFISCL1PPCAC_21935, partial [Pristionchus fissidentatus]
RRLDYALLQPDATRHGIHSNGMVATSMDMLVTFRCNRMSFTKMPFDEQTCFACLNVGSYVYNDILLNVTFNPDDTYTRGTSEWSFR